MMVALQDDFEGEGQCTHIFMLREQHIMSIGMHTYIMKNCQVIYFGHGV